MTEECLPDCNLNVCGDSNLSPTEVCDEGADDNVLEPGACAPDCSGFIETKEIAVAFADNGNLGGNPVSAADGLCPAGFQALIGVPGERQAANAPYQANAVIDWPIKPFTHYVDEDGETVWITDEVPLWGVRDGIPQDLVGPPYTGGVFGGTSASTGIRGDWTLNVSQNCQSWSTAASGASVSAGNSWTLDQYIDAGVTYNCDNVLALYCVEQ